MLFKKFTKVINKENNSDKSVEQVPNKELNQEEINELKAKFYPGKIC